MDQFAKLLQEKASPILRTYFNLRTWAYKYAYIFMYARIFW